jgi:hypothetical protein
MSREPFEISKRKENNLEFCLNKMDQITSSSISELAFILFFTIVYLALASLVIFARVVHRALPGFRISYGSVVLGLGSALGTFFRKHEINILHKKLE